MFMVIGPLAFALVLGVFIVYMRRNVRLVAAMASYPALMIIQAVGEYCQLMTLGPSWIQWHLGNVGSATRIIGATPFVIALIKQYHLFNPPLLLNEEMIKRLPMWSLLVYAVGTLYCISLEFSPGWMNDSIDYWDILAYCIGLLIASIGWFASLHVGNPRRPK